MKFTEKLRAFSSKETAEYVVPESIFNRFKEISDSLGYEENSKQKQQLEEAFEFALNAHEGQTRMSGDPYIIHPLEVMGILAELEVDNVTLLGALLHDVVEDTGITLDDISNKFGPVVGILVDGMTKLEYLRYDTRSNEEKQAEYFRKMLLSMAQDLRVILIKLADRLHNMRTIEAMPINSRKRIAQETLDIYAPLAHRFGIGKIKWELEDLSLKELDEVAYRRIAERVVMKRDEREEAIKNIVEPLEKSLKNENINATIKGRAKHFYSIYNKIKRRGKTFEEILDLLAVRVIVETMPDCYRTLGIVHSLYTPVVEKFTDFIAMPKGNGYQSLHTKVIDKSGHTIEVQIRTQEMDQIAEIGIAAHWQYKEGNNSNKVLKGKLSEYYKWLRQVIEGSREENTSEEFMEALRSNLFTDEIIVFTPRGSLIQLPSNSTPIDFAFAVHTDIGLHTLGAKINNKMVSLHKQLATGDTVEILTSANAKPSMDWLRFVKTSRARSKIKRYFKQIRFEESIRIGEDLLNKELVKHKRKLTRQVVKEILNSYGQPNVESLYAAIGSGDLSLESVCNKICGITQFEEEKSKSILDEIKKITSSKSDSGIKVQGSDNLMTQFGQCCSPLPGDPIIGFISKGRGIIIHRNDCPNVAALSKDPSKIIKVAWEVNKADRFQARLRIYAEDRKNLLKEVADTIGKLDVNIIEANLRSEGQLAVGTIGVKVHGLAHLSKLINRILRLKGVMQVERVNIADVAGKL